MSAESTAVARDVTAEQFDSLVVEASRSRPVVVDFWAPWCGPCHQLAPVLERTATRHVGEVDLVKLDVDTAPAIAQRYRIQGIPAVKAFRDGAVVAEFTGVQPEAVVQRLFGALAPSQADRLVVQAQAASGDERAALLAEAVEAEPNHPGAVVALAELHAERGEVDEARRLLARVPADPEARRLTAELDLGASALDGDERAALRQHAATGDAEASLELGRALAAEGQHDEALELLLTAVREPACRDEARDSLLAVFAVLGDGDERVRAARPRLSAALF